MSLNSKAIYTSENNRLLYKTPKGKEFKCINELNEEYDIDATVSDFNSIAKKFIEESARTREELNCTLDVP